MRRDILVAQTVGAQFNGAGTNYVVQTPAGVLYLIYCDIVNADVSFRKSTDGGVTWGNQTVVISGVTATSCAVWYDRWSDINADLIHVVAADSAADDIFYRNINAASSDALSTQTTVFAGASTAGGGALSITRARGGNLVVAGSIDAGVEDGAWKSTDVGATWGAAIADPSEAATQDQYLLLPGWNADTQDVQLIFWDASADAISVKRYDDSANTWGETSIATSMVDRAATNDFPHYAAAVDITNSRNVLVAWSGVDTLNADLRCFTINDTTITEVTNVVLNSVDDQGLCGISIDTDSNFWYASYFGKSDGSDTWNTSVGLYYKVSQDAGSTWSGEIKASSIQLNPRMLMTTPRFTGKFNIMYYQANTYPELFFNTEVNAPRARHRG